MQSLMRSRSLHFQLDLSRNTSFKKSKTLLGRSVNWSETAAGLSKPHAGPLAQRGHQLYTKLDPYPPGTSILLINSNPWLTSILINSPPPKSQTSKTSIMVNKISHLRLTGLFRSRPNPLSGLAMSAFRSSTLQEASARQASPVITIQETIRPKAMNMGTTHTQLSAM